MRMSQLFAPTLKETPKEAEIVSHKLMLRAGYIRKVAAGIYNFLPLGLRVVRKIEQIVREEMDRAGGQEIRMPSVQPAELWKESKRWDFYGPELLRFNDRKGGEFCFGPTHEEVITDLVRGEIRSYRELPLNLYQIQTKFRDELRPRAGLMRGREFIMKDAYSFDTNRKTAKVSYDRMFEAYNKIFTRCGLDFRPVEADTGNIGGSESHEFQVLAKNGEDAIVSCSNCGYTANVEKAALRAPENLNENVIEEEVELKKVATPNKKTIEDITAFLKVDVKKTVKTVLFIVDSKTFAVLIRGDLAINELKVKTFLRAEQIRLATEQEVFAATNAPTGFAGPINLKVPILADLSIKGLTNVVVGANEIDAHFINVSIERDTSVKNYHDFRIAKDGDPCGKCGEKMTFFRGIEVGHIFQLGTKYSVSMNATYLSTKGKEEPIVMGCYGIGITRIMSAAIEQNHDKDGIIWPNAIAPFSIHILPLQMKNKKVVRLSERIYETLLSSNVDVLLDDRNLRAGPKFKDADLIGIPTRITIGARGVKNGTLEVYDRKTQTSQDVPIEQFLEKYETSEVL